MNFSSLKACFARRFDLLRKPNDYRTFVRLRIRFACLWGSFDLCQSVKKEVFDRLNRLLRKCNSLFFIYFFLFRKM